MVEIGMEPAAERSAAELAVLLGLSRESVHQLLAPCVRSGLVVAVRGRAGGYRAGAGLHEAPLSSVLAPWAGPEPRPPSGRGGGLARLLDALESEADLARRAVYERTSVGDLVSRVAAERGALDWEI